MTASPCNRRARFLKAGAAALALLGAALAPAQALSPDDPTPIGLPEGQTPEQSPDQTPPPQPGAAGTGGIQSTPLPPLPQPQPGAAPEPTITQPAPPSQPGVMQPPPQPAATPTDAPAVNSGAPGLLDDSNAGLGANLWQGSSAAQLITAMPKLPAPQTQPALRDLQLRLLLTKAPGPNAAGGIDTLVPLRAERLHAMGFSTEALMLTKAAGSGAPADAKGAFEKALNDQDMTAACAKADEAIGAQQILDLYWRKALLLCQIERGQEDPARIGLDLLRELPDKDQATKDFVAVAAVLLGEGSKKKLKLKSEPDAVQAALMRKAGLEPKSAQPAAAPKISGPAAAAAIARDATQPLDTRIERGEFAFAAGLLTADELIGLYRQAKFAGDPLTLPDTPTNRGQLYQAADQAFDPVRRAQFLQRALLTAQARGAYFATAALYRPIADKVTPAPNLSWFAPEAARLMFATGNLDRGGFWLNQAQGAQMANPTIARSVPGLQVLAQIAGLTGVYDADPIAAWQQATAASPAAVDKLRGIQGGLGLPGGATLATPAGDAAAIGAAAQAGRRGETALAALVALGGKGLANADGPTLAQALGGLGAVGLGPEARRIAIEAAILAGL